MTLEDEVCDRNLSVGSDEEEDALSEVSDLFFEADLNVKNGFRQNQKEGKLTQTTTERTAKMIKQMELILVSIAWMVDWNKFDVKLRSCKSLEMF